MEYFHSVRLDEDKCKGCTNCIKRCPTEAIRVREGKARIIQERCIDCGECIRICPNHAKIAVGDSLETLSLYRYRIALPAPAFVSQFAGQADLERILGSLIALGFDAVFEVALAAEMVARATRRYLDNYHGKRPLISPACPAVVGLIQVRFPSLVEQLLPLATPMDVAARLAREEGAKATGLPREAIGTFFISPCPAKITAARQPPGGLAGPDGVIPLAAIYGDILKCLATAPVYPSRAGAGGYGWGHSGGENASIGGRRLLEVDGIHHVIEVLTRIEAGDFQDIDYIEAQACPAGCVGGALMVRNPYLARLELRQLACGLPAGPRALPDAGDSLVAAPFRPRPVLQLDADLVTALEKMRRLEATQALLPGLDCGSCGSPSCRALAEDIVRGEAQDTDCVFVLRDRVRVLAEEVVELARKLPPSMAQPERRGGNETAGNSGALEFAGPGRREGPGQRS
ncbi:[Fe-Fe] hydrogenase large subunit C-terminal domain-containing protein [Neomoorella mulderi]|uniref:Periplasmic [Fe] hydrogenase large subunit n=1 Tax=Moorella mulderi DSM 14980 TaxID=1122241 RepID=A0A151AXC8_9FIRM|nr:[Fe-Fe] hydrogenase large subunit C-terminal domain-containing protein [Moorella mulderi]KYH32305.1 periplasmic [Fe] hydrogenase large subunit [Moorella mulderi DSM 14980]